jgi:cytidylate kinase
MSGGKRLAEMLADRLGYRCISREIIVKAADEYGIPEEKLFEAIKRNPSFVQKFTFERERYLAFIQAALCEYAVDDNMIYHGHAGHFLLEGVSHVLRVRIVADLSVRIEAASEQFKLSEKDALKYIERVDKQRVKWTKFLYGKDWRSPELYDIVFNMGVLDLEFACEMIQHAIRQTHFQTTPSSAQAMRNLLTSSRVRAAVARLPAARLKYLEVSADGGTVTVSGRTKSQTILEEILDAANEVPGVETVDNQLEIDYRDHKIE